MSFRVQKDVIPSVRLESNLGELAERSNAAVLKTVSPQGLGGSNPSLSARASPAAPFHDDPLAALAPGARRAFGRSHAELVGGRAQNAGLFNFN
jgi:hypothetical protein